MDEFDTLVKTRIRKSMLEAHEPDFFLFHLKDMADSSRHEAKEALLSGSVAAVDGTDAMTQLSFMCTSAYACAVAYLTTRQRGNPVVVVTQTNTRYTTADRIHEAGRNDLIALSKELEDSRLDQSWPTTFREYQERLMAMTCGVDIVLIDGPIWTQNLITQPGGRDLYGQMQLSPTIFIGVIKNLSGSWPLCKWCGYALEPGEGFVVGRLKTQLLERFMQNGTVRPWLNDLNEDYVRVVYRPHEKVFGYECKLAQLPLATAILLENASPTLNHEIPLLLEMIDVQVRAGFNGNIARKVVIEEIQRRNYRMGVDLRDERDYR
jgi:hypothetical protein